MGETKNTRKYFVRDLGLIYYAYLLLELYSCWIFAFVFVIVTRVSCLFFYIYIHILVYLYIYTYLCYPTYTIYAIHTICTIHRPTFACPHGAESRTRVTSTIYTYIKIYNIYNIIIIMLRDMRNTPTINE